MYSIYPPEFIMKKDDGEKKSPEYIRTNHGVFNVQKNEKGQYVIERFFSTDPKEYLKPSFSPGQVVKIKK